ncbi:MAG: response regulator [candidate division Zixibacteria bacterium]|nr:response regulator [candidate division Zixibacteria bacterium]
MGRKLQVLVIDDEQIVLDSVVKHLRKEDYTIKTVLSAPVALEAINSNPPDIILTDLMMPEIDGLELMKIVKEKHPQIPIIMVTGYATINTALQATQLGAFDYIAKPFTRSELQTVVRRAEKLARGKAEAKGEASDHAHSQANSRLKTIGDHIWLMVEEGGLVRLGIERSFLHTVGKIQNIFLPSVGDKLRQGSVYLELFSSDLRAHTVLSPLTGTIVEVNTSIVEDPSKMLEDPYGEGWLIRLKPSRFEIEIKELGL